MKRGRTMSNYKKLLGYIPYFENKNIVFCKWESMYPKYDRKLEQFIKDVYATDLLKHDYIDYLDEKLKVEDYSAAVHTADMELLKAILTFNVRAERFCDGSWASAVKEGVFLSILYRLRELD